MRFPRSSRRRSAFAALLAAQAVLASALPAGAELPPDLRDFLGARGQRASTFVERAVAKGRLDPSDWTGENPQLTPAEVGWVLQSQEAFKIWTGDSWCADDARRRQAEAAAASEQGATLALSCRRLADDANARDARIVLRIRAGTFNKGTVDGAYQALRGINPVHFLADKLIVVATGKEPVGGEVAPRVGALGDALLYLLYMKGASWVGREMAEVRALRRWSPPQEMTAPGRLFPPNMVEAREHFFLEEPSFGSNYKVNGVTVGHNRVRFMKFAADGKRIEVISETPLGGYVGGKGFSVIRYKIRRTTSSGAVLPEFISRRGDDAVFLKTVFDPAKATRFDVENIMLDMYDSIYVSLVSGADKQTLRSTLSLDGSVWEARAAGGRLKTFYNVSP